MRDKHAFSTAKAEVRIKRLNPDLKKTADLLFVYYTIIEMGDDPTTEDQEEVLAHLKKLTKDKKWNP